jgi:hypothetical protein
MDSAVDSADGDNPVALLDGLDHLLHLFLLLILGADDEEIKHHEYKAESDEGGNHLTARAACRGLEKYQALGDRIHIQSFT